MTNRLRRRDDGSLIAALSVLCDRLLDRVQQILISNRFGEELDRAALHGPNRHRDIGVATDKDNRHAQIGPGQLLLKIEPTAPGQPDVENQAPGQVRRRAIEEFLDRREQLDAQLRRRVRGGVALLGHRQRPRPRARAHRCTLSRVATERRLGGRAGGVTHLLLGREGIPHRRAHSAVGAVAVSRLPHGRARDGDHIGLVVAKAGGEAA